MAHRTCPIDEDGAVCGRPVRSPGLDLCSRHYQRWRNHGTFSSMRRTAGQVAPIAHGDVARVPLTQGLWAVVDLADTAKVAGYWWKATPIRTSSRTRYATTMGDRLKMHRLIMDFGPGDPLVDHIDGDGLNNRRSNLRTASQRQNMANSRRPRGGSSRFRGVCWHGASGKWRSYVKSADGRQISCGLYENEVDAALARDLAAIEHYGEFAVLNFPDGRPAT